MRKFLMGTALALLALASSPANAADRNGDIGHLQRQCEHGDHKACQQVKLHRDCERGNRGACETLHLHQACDGGDHRACERARFQERH